MHEAIELLHEDRSLGFLENVGSMNIGRGLTKSVVLAVLLHPFLGWSLNGDAAHSEEDGANDGTGFEARVGTHSVVADGNSKSRDEPHSEEPHEMSTVNRVHSDEERYQGEEVENSVTRSQNPVEQRLLNELRVLCLQRFASLRKLAISRDPRIAAQLWSNPFNMRTNEGAEIGKPNKCHPEFGQIVERIEEDHESADGRHENEEGDD